MCPAASTRRSARTRICCRISYAACWRTARTPRSSTASSTIDRSLTNAVAAQPAWDALPAASRAKILEHAADLLEQRRAQFVALLVREAGKTLPAAISEVREAADMCRYYAAIARKLFQPENLPGP